jgi:hypothetical protein
MEIDPDTDIGSLSPEVLRGITASQFQAMTPEQQNTLMECSRAESRKLALAQPLLTTEQVVAQGADPRTSDLLHLPEPEGDLYPAFQFDGDGQPKSVVLAVNQILAADAIGDHYAVMWWWLMGNRGLAEMEDQTPIGQLDKVPDSRLIELAVDYFFDA